MLAAWSGHGDSIANAFADQRAGNWRCHRYFASLHIGFHFADDLIGDFLFRIFDTIWESIRRVFRLKRQERRKKLKRQQKRERRFERNAQKREQKPGGPTEAVVTSEGDLIETGELGETPVKPGGEERDPTQEDPSS